jgi:hypothetical protein
MLRSSHFNINHLLDRWAGNRAALDADAAADRSSTETLPGSLVDEMREREIRLEAVPLSRVQAMDVVFGGAIPF